MWKQLTTSNMDIAMEEFQARMKKDTGLLKLGPDNSTGQKAVTEERLMKILPELEQYYELWLAYPDKLVDLLMPIDTQFKLLPFQILALRVNQRHKLVYQTATRGGVKHFSLNTLFPVITGVA